MKDLKKITVIGGSGFVGSHFMMLLKNNETSIVTNIDKRPSPFFPDKTQICNVLDKANLTVLLKGADLVVLLAAEHRDDVSPVSLYYDVNVGGMRKTLEAMEACGIKRMIFTSTVAVYGLNTDHADETAPAAPFNHYGKSKWQAECVLQEWYREHPDWDIRILRPTVIFGERNRGNVYNLLKQIAGGKFLLVGKGNNVKSMAYVGNVVAFMKYLADDSSQIGYCVYNYIDKPDFTMNALVDLVGQVLHKRIPSIHIPYWLGMLGGYCFDIVAFISRKKLTVSSVRVKKFCATTLFDATKVSTSGFRSSYTLKEGLARTLEYEFLHPKEDGIVFQSE